MYTQFFSDDEEIKEHSESECSVELQDRERACA